MGCISSKLGAADLREERTLLCDGGGDCPNHVVSLTSSTYGVLTLDRDDNGGGRGQEGDVAECRRPPATLVFPRFHKKVFAEEPEVINAWELMGDLDDDVPVYSPETRKKIRKPRRRGPLVASPKGIMFLDANVASPRKKKLAGKENLRRLGPERPGIDAARVLRPFSSSDNAQRMAPAAASAVQFKPTNTANLKIQVTERNCGGGSFRPRRSFSPGPLFDPELVAALEREHWEQGDQIKKMVSAPAPWNREAWDAADATLILESFAKKCPPGGEAAAVLYTTTLRGIRKTFEDCNAVRSAIESHGVRIVERDISMDSGFREELRFLMGRREVRMPMLFVKGRLVGGAEEVLRLEEEGTLGLLLAGIPRAAAWCDGCGGVRFVLCMDCSGSCKVLDEEENKTVKCGECNENGLIRCPICC